MGKTKAKGFSGLVLANHTQLYEAQEVGLSSIHFPSSTHHVP